jgi:hypothetical protein
VIEGALLSSSREVDSCQFRYALLERQTDLSLDHRSRAKGSRGPPADSSSIELLSYRTRRLTKLMDAVGKGCAIGSVSERVISRPASRRCLERARILTTFATRSIRGNFLGLPGVQTLPGRVAGASIPRVRAAAPAP